MKLIWLAAFALSACAQSKAFDAEKSEQQIRETLYAFAEAMNEGDIEQAGSYYSDAPGFYWVERGDVQYDSADAARRSLQSLGESGFSVKVEYTDIHISLLGQDAAVASVKFESDFTRPDGGSFGFGGWQTTGLVRTEQGWKLAGGHTEAITPPN